MNVAQLRYFITVAQLENISKAAELLYLKQPALSKNISKLEEELGTPLFERNGKHLSLNVQGKRFLECANTVLRELELAESDIKRMVSGGSGHIRIGAAGCAEKILRCAAAFRTEHPDCDFEFDFSIEELEAPDINDYDVLIYPDGIRYDKFEGYDFGTERYFLAAAASHPLSAYPVLSIKHLSGLDYVFVRKGKFYSEFSHRVCTALNIPFRSVCYTDTRQSQLQIIASGMAVGLIPEGMGSSIADENVRLIPLDSRRFSRKMKICFKRDKHLSPVAREFKEAVLQRLQPEQNRGAAHETV